MLNIYICEDDALQRSTILNRIEKTMLIEAMDMEIILASDSPTSILKSVKQNPGVGLYFLDIDIPGQMNGLNLARLIREEDPRGFIVFITAHSEMSMLTFNYKVEALDFILKDEPDKLEERIRDCILKANERFCTLNNRVQKNYIIKISDKNIVINYCDILYFETSSSIHKVILHTMNKKVEFTGKLKDIETIVDDRFYRCHRSFLINVKNILQIDINKKTVIMKNKDICLVSVRKMKGLKEKAYFSSLNNI